ncbi:HAD-IA family hydrolase [Amylibacter sp. SFDW26]|uniref:HAD-IA family hydrolase n=1 Tax=Amylibacter sp. SFDW26 TaxID=2652722 RepID=UPI001261C334|nr:HAD-IA family hydrolase [Amylibacter sp. SFDW26]KAB7616298.1 HAD-IA family hydrolase [Amylibacter sp. SFDW26]
MKSVIFDLDGTLADTSGDLLAAANACFVKMGEKPQLKTETDAGTALKGGRAMLNLGFSRLGVEPSEELMVENYNRLLEVYDQNIDDHTFLYDGAETCLKELTLQGYALGICTNKPEALAEKLITRLGIRHYFGALLGADTLPVRKPDAGHLLGTIKELGGNPSKSVLIGDTATDRNAAKNAWVSCILVTFGPDGRDVTELEPEGLLDHYNDLPDILKVMIPN